VLGPRATSRRLVVPLVCLVFGLVAPLLPALPAGAAGCEVTGPAPGDERLPPEQRALLAVVRSLPLDVKLGQMLMTGFVGTQPDAGLLDRARRGHVGGFFLLQRNVRDAEQVRDLTARLAEAAASGSLGARPFVSTDFEGGTVNALQAVTGGTPSAADLAARGVPGVEARGTQDAALLTSLGFNVNLAPVADVLSARSEVIGSRAFSSDPEQAAALSRAYLRGLQRGNVIAVMKHFPGHGSTTGDSHVLLPRVDRSLAQLEGADLVPYQQAIAAGDVEAVMMGHLLVPAIDPDTPTSISRPAVAGLLRDRLRFDGLVMTDELKMGAISGRYSPSQAATMAVQAGVDVILADYTGAEQDAVLQALARACQSGQIPEGRVEQSAARVVRLKLAHGLAGPELTGRYEAQLRATGVPPGSRPATTRPAPPAAPAQRPVDLGGRALPPQPDGTVGRLYDEAAGSGGAGYAVLDAGGIALWEGYAAGGGPARLGYPISQRFELDGSVVQATQRGLLRWDPEKGTSEPANVLELFDRAGASLQWPGCAGPDPTAPPAPNEACALTGWLEQRGIPAAIPDDGSGGDFRHAVATRLSWLEHPALRAAYLADPAGGGAAPWPGDGALAAGLEGVPDAQIPWAAIERFGLPMSRPARFGPFLAQRFQRIVLQLWLDEVPGMPAPGTVTQVLAGELLREAGLIPQAALIPVAPDGTPGSPPQLPPPPGPPPAPAGPPGGAPSNLAGQPPAAPSATGRSDAATPTAVSPQATPTPPATATAASTPTSAPPATATPRPAPTQSPTRRP
jgi:beta-N-acetylhexosaminidase